VLTNLLANAIKYSPQADQIVVRSTQDREAERVVVAVQDFGIGIPQDEQPRVFERFYRVTAAGRDDYAGLGLGIYIAAEFIRRHGGDIWVESEEGHGTTVAFALPVGPSGEDIDREPLST
jgi:signal transduction histidine kinase